MGILKYWRIFATIIVIAAATLVSNIVSGISGTLSGAIAVNQMNGGNAGYIAARAANGPSFAIELLVTLMVVLLMIAIWAPAVKRLVNNSK